MKKTLTLVVLFALTVSLVAAVGCGKKTTTNPEGSATVTDNGNGDSGNVTVKDENGNDSTYQLSDEAPSEAELGAPIYPGATYVPGSGGSSGATSTEGSSAVASADFTSTDSLNKVVDWYTGKLGNPLSTTDSQYVWMPNSNVEGSNFVTVNVKADGGTVTISIASLGTSK